MLNRKLTKTKSANWIEERKTPKQEYKINCNNANNINNIKKNTNIKDFSPLNSLDLDFNIKNESEIELADKIYKANQLKIKESEIEDEEINSLNEQIRTIMLKNYKIQKNIENQLNLRIYYEKNQNSIAAYINDLNNKFRNYDSTIEQYESKINKIRRENKQLQNEYDIKIEKIDKENEKLRKRIRDRIELYMYQKGQIIEKSAKTENIKKEIQMQNDTINERIDLNKKKVGNLEDKYDELVKKIINMKVNCEDQKLKDMIDNNLNNIEESGRKIIKKEDEKKKEALDIKNKIDNCKINNDELLFEIKELNDQYQKLIKSQDNSKDKDKKTRYSFHSTTYKTLSNTMKYSQTENKFK
jgi:DNA repair exonuclease SbcCD ATPase subunit